MYKPLFNKVLVEVNDQDAKWGSGNNDNIGGEVYREGKLIETGQYFATADYPVRPEEVVPLVESLLGKTIMWHEGHEAGTVFEENGKKYALIYWWDVIGVKDVE